MLQPRRWTPAGTSGLMLEIGLDLEKSSSRGEQHGAEAVRRPRAGTRPTRTIPVLIVSSTEGLLRRDKTNFAYFDASTIVRCCGALGEARGRVRRPRREIAREAEPGESYRVTNDRYSSPTRIGCHTIRPALECRRRTRSRGEPWGRTRQPVTVRQTQPKRRRHSADARDVSGRPGGRSRRGDPVGEPAPQTSSTAGVHQAPGATARKPVVFLIEGRLRRFA